MPPPRRCQASGACVLAARMASSARPAGRVTPATMGALRTAMATAAVRPPTTTQRRWQSGHHYQPQQQQQAYPRVHGAPAQQPPPPPPPGGQFSRPPAFAPGPSPFSSSAASRSSSSPFTPRAPPPPQSSSSSSNPPSSSSPSPFSSTRSSSPSPFSASPTQRATRDPRRDQGDRTWGQLQRRTSPQQHQQQQQNGRGMNARGPDARGGQGKENFWAQLEARVGGDGHQRRGGAGGPDRRRLPAAMRDNWGAPAAAGERGDRGARGTRGDRGDRGEPAAASASSSAAATEEPALDYDAEPGLDVDAIVGEGRLSDVQSPWEHHRKGKKERPAAAAAAAAAAKTKAKAKAQQQGRRAGFGGGDEDLSDEAIERIEARRQRKEERRRQKEAEAAAEAAAPVPILLPQFISVANLGTALGVRTEVFLGQLGELGFDDIAADSVMTGETAALIAQEYGFEPTVDAGEAVDLQRQPPATDLAAVPTRPPIVTIMGHVDHGKTTMLDWLRQSSVAAQEHGGITQHIGAFSVQLAGSGRQITFLDTPGHAAFLSMRQRGAHVTDIVILVVAADDSVKPQTLEALKHARAAQVPLIVAINKVDKEGARVEQVKADLARHGVELEDFGGDVQAVCVSGKTGQGMGDLEEAILTLAEILDVRAEPEGVLAEGWVLESSVKPVGRAATVLVKRGTLRRGDLVAAGTTWARVRVLRNEAGLEIDEAPPGTPVEILGWRELPDAGDEVLQAPSEARARAAIEYRREVRDRGKAAADAEAQGRREREAREAKQEAAAAERAALGEAGEEAVEQPLKRRRRGAAKANKPVHTLKTTLIETDTSGGGGVGGSGGGAKAVNFTVRADVTGSVEAVAAAILEIVDSNHEVRPQVLRAEAGMVTEFDVEHAAATQSAIVHFNRVPVAPAIRRMAEAAGVPLLEHTVIYRLVEDVRAQMTARLKPAVTTRVLGEAEVLQVFPINVRGRLYKNIAGCRVRNGQVARSGRYRVFRDGEQVFEGALETLKHGKKEVTEMRKGSECGMSFDGWDGLREGDKIQMFEEVEVRREL